MRKRVMEIRIEASFVMDAESAEIGAGEIASVLGEHLEKGTMVTVTARPVAIDPDFTIEGTCK